MNDFDSCIMRVDFDQAVKRELKEKGGGSLPYAAPWFLNICTPSLHCCYNNIHPNKI